MKLQWRHPYHRDNTPVSFTEALAREASIMSEIPHGYEHERLTRTVELMLDLLPASHRAEILEIVLPLWEQASA